MGSLCCVAARPHGTSAAGRDWSMGGSDPFWRANMSFSPPLSRRWDYRFNSDGFIYGSQGDGMTVHHGSSYTSSKGSRSWERNEVPPEHHNSASEGTISYLSSPANSFRNWHLMPSLERGLDVEEYTKLPSSEPLSSSLYFEGAERSHHNGGSTSSRSDDYEYGLPSKAHCLTPRSFGGRLVFMSKPVYPLSFPGEDGQSSIASTSSGATLKSNSRTAHVLKMLSPAMENLSISRVDSLNWSSTSSMDLADVSESVETEPFGNTNTKSDENAKCDLCERLLSKRSPWGSRRIIRTGDMPVAGVLPCRHVFHAECLDRATPKGQKHNPPCPMCERLDDKDTEQWAVCRLSNGLPRLKPLGEGPSRVWSCAQARDCVAGALQVQKSNGTQQLGHNRHKRHASPLEKCKGSRVG